MRNPYAQSAHPAAARLQTVGLSSEGRMAWLGARSAEAGLARATLVFISLVVKIKPTPRAFFLHFTGGSRTAL